ncbi:MAG TPA: AraC family transcriptional regulator [Mesotoga infera]|uniref:AraC family transcriptional regulator n=1 Tax=Mesotoga infera TaxID=1236046 RepID=A0A7C1CUY7_9BACT|nr:AraC family transcriptional regulator [Mesotoga infera]
MPRDTSLKEDYIDSVNSVIDYIEEHLSSQITLDDLCSESFYSSVHLQRIFFHTVGETIGQYRKGRRLSVAADKLATTSMTILEIALQLGYDSQESFTRAFKSKYYVTPGKYRRLGLHFVVTQKKRLSKRDLMGTKGGMRMEPKIVHKPAFKVIGLKYYGNDPANNCPKLWRDFMERHTEIENVISVKESYGLMCTGVEDFVDGKFDYIASVAVSSLENIPEGMVGAVIPEATYAVFTHNGKLDSLQETYEYIYGKWFQNSEYEPIGLNEFEFYDERFTGEEDSELYIYVPIKKKQ